ncbi:MAG: right-handed parallel beta-helix repeat-containing protein [Novosphingobium sp.]|nr:right-handed parallel beta-helix repeat-containing protein [Novosphingobium sp.]
MLAIAVLACGSAAVEAKDHVPAIARTLYIDCERGEGGDGSLARPLTTLAAANERTLGAGDRLLLRRGTRCTGTLAPHGNGAPGKPILIGAYGDAHAPLPRIDAGGANAAVALADQSHVIVEDLELTNAGNPQGLHRGVHLASVAGIAADITLRRLNIHDVEGDNSFAKGKPGGGIIGDATNGGRFADVLIEGNTIRDVSRSGIFFTGTTSRDRPAAGQPWPAASTGVVIRGNSAERIQGDGIVALGTIGALLERNVVRHANLGGFDFHSPKRNCAAGIWAWNANRTVIQYNEVSDTHFGPGGKGCDGTGFDIDFNQDETIVQYNTSFHNEGGFVLLCAADAPRRAVVRYNLSIEDGSAFSGVPCSFSGSMNPATMNLNGVLLYNNTFVGSAPRIVPEGDPAFAERVRPFLGTLEFRNNIVFATSPAGPPQPFDCGDRCRNNLFFNMAPHGTAAMVGDPRFLDPTRRGTGLRVAEGYRVQASSPVARAGVPVAAGAFAVVTTDFFGKRISTPPSLGFAEPGR